MCTMHADSWLVGRYRLGRRIGSGGVGQVWSAQDTVLDREVAIKVQEIDPDFDRATFERFTREARSAAALQHPNVVTIFDSGTDGDTAFLVMELLPGPTLTGYLAEHGPLPEADAVALAAQIASGLAAAHRAGVVHRDIKPANLMFDARGTLKIVDFGIARLVQATTTQLTVANGIIGSPPYLSPEGIDGRSVDERSDIYALGAVLMVMLTGRGPFEAAHPLALLQQHLHAPPPQLRDRRPDISPALNALVAAMLSKSPEDRPQTALDLLRHLNGEPYEAPEPAGPALARMTREPTAPLARPRSSLGTGFLAGAGAMALVAAVVMAMANRAGMPGAGLLEPSLALLPTAAAADTSASSPTTTSATAATPSPTAAAPTVSTPSAAESRRAEPPSGTRSPTEARTTERKPSPKASASVTRSRPTTSRTPTPRPAEVDSSAASLQSALADLRAAVGEVSSSGQLGAKQAADLDRRVDGLARQLETKRGAEAAKKVDGFDDYVAGLARKGQLTPAGEQRITTASSEVRDLVATAQRS
jgi:eukaryotic-like serine/threonine-protein kinase